MNNPEGNIRYIEEVPSTYRSVFGEYPCFNTVQSTVLDDALKTDNSLVVSAPTGSGKTAIFEMAIVRLLMLNEQIGSAPNTKMIYISPIKALCRERLIDWHKKFSDYGLKCISLTSETDNIDARNISQYNIIISTPEKWDVVTRRWRDNHNFIAAINLFMIDEVHLLNDDCRGSTLEVIVSRMKTAEAFLMLNQGKTRIRFIALSATIPNVEDIAEWIEPNGTAKYFKFSEDVRPVKLNKVIYGFNPNTNSTFKFDLFLNYKVPNLIYKYSKGKPALVTTSTLAMGVNLPAHLVIVKGTKRYDSKEGYKDYDEVSIFQMIGRAGRSQFDTSATALILTSTQDKIKYEKMLGCTQNIESNLHKHLTEHLNAEIVLKTITDLEVAMNWLSSTFLYVRARKCPEKYKLPAGLSKEKTDKKLLEICKIDLNKLVRAGMIRMNEAIEVAPTIVGEIMAKYYIAFNTMELFTKITGNEIMIQILALISKCHEFSEIYLRSNDKKCLNLLNRNLSKESNRFPLTGKIKTVDMKINCIIQAVLGNLDISDQSILNDSIKVMQNCERLSKCLIEYLETRVSKCYTALLNTTILAKCFHVKLWENSPYVSKQLTGVGQVISTLLVKAGKTSFKEIINTNPRHIETIIGRKAPFGDALVDEASHLPEYELTLEKCNSHVNVIIKLLNNEALEKQATVNLNSKMTLLVGDSENNILLYEKYGHCYMLTHPRVTRSINIENNDITFVTADLISEDWVGFDCNFKLEIAPKPTYVINQPKSDQNKNNKQTLMEKYIQHTRKSTTYKNKNEPRTISKKSVLNKRDNPSCVIPEDKNIANKNNKDKNNTNNYSNIIFDNEKLNTTNVNLYVKENEPKSVPKENKVSNEKNQSCVIQDQYEAITSKEKNADETLSKNNTTANDIDSTESVDKNYSDLKDTESKPTSESKQKIENSDKKTRCSKKKKILVSKSLFRIPSKSKISKKLEKRFKSKNVDNKSQNNNITDKIKIDQDSKHGNKAATLEQNKIDFEKNKFHMKQNIGGFKNNRNILESSKSQTNFKNLYNTKGLYDSSNYYQNKNENMFNRNNQNSGNSLQTFNNTSNVINRTVEWKDRNQHSKILTNNKDHFLDGDASGEFFSYESEINLIMDSLERNENISEQNKIQQNNAIFKNLNDANTFKNVNNHLTLQENNKRVNVSNNSNNCLDKLSTPKTSMIHENDVVSRRSADNNTSDQCSQIRVPCENENFSNWDVLEDLCPPLESQRKFITNNFKTNKNIMERNRSTTFDHNNDNSNNNIQSLFTPVSQRCNSRITNSQNSKTLYFLNNNQNNTIMTKRNDKEHTNENYNKTGDALENNNKHFFEEVGKSKLHAELYKKYNFQIQLEGHESDQHHQEEHNGSVNTAKTVEENHDEGVKTTMDNPHSTGYFLTPYPKRHKRDAEYSVSFEELQPKSIKWRSPLVHSPPEKTFCFSFGDGGTDSKDDTKESNDLRSGTQETSSSSTNLNLSENSQIQKNRATCSALSKKKFRFPLCDQEYMDKNESINKNNKNLGDICDLEYYGLVNRQSYSQKDTAKNNSRPTTTAGTYYSQLMSSQRSNYKKDSKIDESTEKRDMSVTFEPLSNNKLVTPENLQMSAHYANNFTDPSSTMRHSQVDQHSKPFQTSLCCPNISHECCANNCNSQDYTPSIPSEYRPNIHHCNFENGNYSDGIDTVHQEIPMAHFPANDDFLNHSFFKPQKPNISEEELAQRRFGHFYFDDGRYALQPSPYSSHQHPFRDKLMYRHHEMFPYPIPSRYPATMSIRYPVPRYDNIDPCIKERYPSFRHEHNYPVGSIDNLDPRATPSFHSQMNTILKDNVGQYRQQPDDKRLYIVNSENDKNQESMNHFEQRSPCKRDIPCRKNDQSYRLNSFFQSNLFQQENCDPQLTHNNKDNFMAGQTSSNQTIFNIQSESDKSLQNSTSKVLLQNSEKLEGLSKKNISKIYSQTPKRQLIHNPNVNLAQRQTCGLPITPHPHLMPSSSQRRFLNRNSFEERLDNIILPRNPDFNMSATRGQHYDPRMDFSAPPYQPNDKEFVMNRFLFSDDRNYR